MMNLHRAAKIKRILGAAGILFFLFFSPAFGGAESEAGPAKDMPVEMDVARHEDGVVFRFGVASDPEKEAPSVFLTRYYSENSGFKELIITCFLPLETAFPSDEYNAAAAQVYDLYDAFIGLGVSEKDVYISVRFEQNIAKDGVITVEFLEHANYFQRAGRNFINGITDIVSSPMELPMGMVTETQKSGVVTGMSKGVFSGFGQAVRKAGTGAIKLLTFWAG